MVTCIVYSELIDPKLIFSHGKSIHLEYSMYVIYNLTIIKVKHNGIILSTLNISHHDFALVYPKDLIPIEI